MYVHGCFFLFVSPHCSLCVRMCEQPIGKDITMFTKFPSFFVKDQHEQRVRVGCVLFPSAMSLFYPIAVCLQGIHCRFGMPSIIAESHYDGGRNFIAMVRGKKRYIINHPSQCPYAPCAVCPFVLSHDFHERLRLQEVPHAEVGHLSEAFLSGLVQSRRHPLVRGRHWT